MSDCFDHAMGACNDMISRDDVRGDGDGGDAWGGEGCYEGLGVSLPMKGVITGSARALLVELGKGFEVTRKWIPKSQIRHIGDSSITVSNWFYNRVILQIRGA